MISTKKETSGTQPGAASQADKNVKSRKVKFQVKAEKGSNVALAGSFNNWDPKSIKLKQNGDGCYATTVSLPPGRHEYKFLVNDQWQVDKQCANVVRNSLGTQNSVIEVA